MTFTREQFERISHLLPKQRGNVAIDNYTLFQGLLYAVENGGKWRKLPSTYGRWNSLYRRINRWAKNGVLERVFATLQQEKIIALEVKVLALDSTSSKLHPDAHGALKKTAPKPSENPAGDGTPRFMWLPRLTRLSWKSTFRGEPAMMPPRGAKP
jgi:transposase